MMLPIPPVEYRERLERLQSSVAQAGLDVFVVSGFDSIYYLTGAGFEPLERPFFLLVYPDGSKSPVLLVPMLDAEHMSSKARNIGRQHIQTYWEYPAPEGRGWPERLCDLIGGAKEIGVEPTLGMEIYERLRGYTVHVRPLVEQLRLIKSPSEVEMIARAARYADLGVRRLLAASYYGATVAEGFAQTRSVTSKIIREVHDWEPLTTKVVMATWAAPWSAQPHSIPWLTDELREGPHVALVLTRLNGYAAESERTYFTARPDPEDREAFGAMTAARERAFTLIRPGVSCAELDGEIDQFLRNRSYSGQSVRLHRTGHGLGLGNHEAPWIAEGSSDLLAADMVISIEPGVYLEGRGGFRHSDTVLVTEDGYRLLTDLPTDIERLTMTGLRPFTRLRGKMVRWALRLSRKPRRRPNGVKKGDATLLC
jgi:Xaa-Pro dipeptidase